MDDHTIKNLREVEDLAAGAGFGEIQEARFAFADLHARETGLSYHVLKPDKRQAFAHRHDTAEEIYVVVAGSGRVKLDGDCHEISTLDAIRVAPSVKRAFEAGPDGLEVLAFGARHEGDGEILREEGFWEN